MVYIDVVYSIVFDQINENEFAVFCFMAGLFIVLTVPALYERYEESIDRYVLMAYRKLCQLYVKINEAYVSKIHNWILEKKKLS